MKNILRIVLFIALVPIIYFLLRTIANLYYNSKIQEHFAREDFLRVMSQSLSALFFVIIWFLICVNMLIILMRKGSIKNIIKKLYKPLRQIVDTLLAAIASFIILFIIPQNMQLILFISSFFVGLLLIIMGINITINLKEYREKIINPKEDN